jgi:eukaryotic-like serine/threonine-protein kinase
LLGDTVPPVRSGRLHMKSTNPVNGQPTTVYPPPVPSSGASAAAVDVTPKPRCRLEFAPGSAHPSGGELESLLRSRLRAAALIVLVPFLYYFFKHWIAPERDFAEAVSVRLAHVILIAMTIGANALLWSNKPLSMRSLRMIEVSLFGMTACFFALMQYFIFCIEHMCSIVTDTPGVVRLAIGASGVRWFFLIVIYGVFIPNTWKRCAIATISTALLAIALTLAAAFDHGRVNAELVSALSDMAILMGIGVAVAVFGSYRIQALQQEASQARQLGQYRLKQRLGSGGMGDVYLAEHLLLRRPCAVKLIRPDHARDGRNVRRFEREVRAMATLTHWNTVEIFDYGHADDGTFYYVMEYLPGQTLEALVTRYGALPPERVVHFLRQICRALREAHGIGLLHRDIKPSNVLACERGGVFDVAKLLDFGLVQDVGLNAEANRLTVVGSIVGSPPFMSPEQASGKPLDARSDIYSVGTLAFYMLTGQPPFPRDTPMQMLMAHAYEPVPSLTTLRPGIPHDLQEVVYRCLEKDPTKRWADAGSLEKALGSCECADEWTDEQAESWWREQRSYAATTPNVLTSLSPILAESPVPAG